MKIAIIHPFQFRLARGIERFTWSLAEALSRRGVEVDLLTWHWPHPVNWGQIPPLVRIHQMPDFRYFMNRWAIGYYLGWLLRGRYDWVMVFFAGYGEAETLSLLRRLRHQRYCVVFHYPREQVPHRYSEFERFGLARRADCLVAVSKYVARGVEAQFGRKCTVIGDGVDPQTFRPSEEKRAIVRRRLGVPTEAPILITLAALEERKGIQWVIRAIPHLLKEFPDLHYLIFGEGSYRPALEFEIQRLGVKRNVSLMGNSNDIVPYLAASDVGCLLSYGESFGMALIEYMAVELPVVASYHPPFDELVQPAWGVMVDEKDTDAVVSEIRELLLNPQRRHTMGQVGRQQVLQHHTWTRVADEYLQLLAE